MKCSDNNVNCSYFANENEVTLTNDEENFVVFGPQEETSTEDDELRGYDRYSEYDPLGLDQVDENVVEEEVMTAVDSQESCKSEQPDADVLWPDEDCIQDDKVTE